MPIAETAEQPMILLTGGSGYVGGRLIPLVEQQGAKRRCLARNPDTLRPRVVGRHLIEGLKNPTVVRDRTALDVFPIRPMGVKEAIREAIASMTT